MSITTSSDGLHQPYIESKTTKDTSIKPKTIELQEHTSESKEVINMTTVEEEFLGIEQNEQKHDLYYNIRSVMIPSIQKDGKTNTKSEANYTSLMAPAKLTDVDHVYASANNRAHYTSLIITPAKPTDVNTVYASANNRANYTSLMTPAKLTEEKTLCAIPKHKGRNSRGKVYKCITLTYHIGCVVTLLILSALVAAVHVEIENIKISRSEVDKYFSSTLISLEQSQHTIAQADNANINDVLESINRTFFSYQEIATNVLRTYEKQSPCADILHRNPSSPSGYYRVGSNCTGARLVYCDMSLTCGGITGGWMRIAQLDPQHCPTGFTNTSFNGTQTCIPHNQSSGCTSVSFNTSGISYSKVCGRIRGYGIGTVDGFYESGVIRGSSVEDNYLDGVSITSSGTHIWSFVAGGCSRACLLEHRLGFVGDDFSCESRYSGCSSDNMCVSSLWDQDDCRVVMPFFFKTLSTSTSADVTMSVCRDEIRDYEDIALTEAELYVY